MLVCARFLSVWIGLCAIGLFSLTASAQQPGGRGPGGGGFGGGFGGGGGTLGLLANEKVAEELALTSDQTEQVKTIRDKVREETQAIFQGGGRGGNREELFEKVRTVTADAQKQVDKILIPRQAKRLKQLEFQQRMTLARGGVTGALVSDSAVEELGITDDQKEALTEKIKEVDQEMRAKIAKVRQEAQQKLLDTLTADQRKKWKELSGDPFDFGQVGFGGFGGGFGGGGAGGAGGQGGARRGGGTRPQQENP